MNEGAEHHLKCSSCDQVLHYQCGIGYEDPVKAFRVSLGKQQYKCPICIVADTHKLIIMALQRHDQLTTHPPPVAPVPVHDAAAVQEGGEADPEVDGDAAPGGDGVPPPHVNDGAPPPHVNDGAPQENLAGDISLASGSSIHPYQPERRRTSTVRSDRHNGSFRPVLSDGERQRVRRCKGMLFGLKHISGSVDTLLLLDSNGRGILEENIDGSGRKVCLRAIGGLCCAATTQALKECKLRYSKIKHMYIGLGTNDHNHRREHPGQRVDYIKGLDHEARKVFPNAKIHFILPFAAIKGLGADYVSGLAESIKDAGVHWEVHQPSAMKGKLVGRAQIHLTPGGRVAFTKWLSKLCAPGAPPFTAHSGQQSSSQYAQIPTGHVHANVASQYNQNYPSLSVVNPAHAGVNTVHAGVNPVHAGDINVKSGESNSLNIDSLLKERLFELVMAPQNHLRHPNYRTRWEY